MLEKGHYLVVTIIFRITFYIICVYRMAAAQAQPLAHSSPGNVPSMMLQHPSQLSLT